MNKKVKYFSYAIAFIAVAAVMTIAIYAATSASSRITANVSWTATEGITFELEAWVVNNPNGGVDASTTPKSITKQIVTANTSNTAANNLAGDLTCGFYDYDAGTVNDDGVNNPSPIQFTYKIKNTGSNILKVTATKSPQAQSESGTTASDHKPNVALSSSYEGAITTTSQTSALLGTGYNIPAGGTLTYTVVLSINNADLNISSFDAGVTFSFGVGAQTEVYINNVSQSLNVSATTIGNYVTALNTAQYPGYYYDSELTVPVPEADYNIPLANSTVSLYTKPATLSKLNFTSNGNGTCSVKGAADPGGEVVIPLVSPAGDRVTSLAYEAFWRCSDITSITIPGSVTSIGQYAFYGCSGLKSITFQYGITTISYEIFQNCTSLTTINIPDSVTSLGSAAFTGSTSLRSIYIPSSVTSISAFDFSTSPFVHCSSSLRIYCGARSKPSGWGPYWNYTYNNSPLSVTWGVTRAQYDALYA